MSWKKQWSIKHKKIKEQTWEKIQNRNDRTEKHRGKMENLLENEKLTSRAIAAKEWISELEDEVQTSSR